MGHPYLITVADCAGVREEHRRKTFAEALRLVNVIRRVCGSKYAITVQNLDYVDVGNDGLTEDERDEL